MSLKACPLLKEGQSSQELAKGSYARVLEWIEIFNLKEKEKEKENH